MLTRAFNLAALGLVLVPTVSLILNFPREHAPSIELAAPGSRIQVPASTPSANDVPDIYYLVFDRYAGKRSLKEFYQFDNDEFLERLRKLGFFVADNSRANYTKTAHSLVSSLHMRHLTDLTELLGSGSSDWKPLYEMLQENVVVSFLKSLGYRYVHLGSWWSPTRRNRLAEENFNPIVYTPWESLTFNEFEWLVVEPMMPTRLAGHLSGKAGNRNRRQYFRVQKKFEKLIALGRQDSPLFVFAHMLLPHEPYVFYPDGGYKTEAEAGSMSRQKNYVDQLVFTNLKIEELVRELLSKDPQPVVIVQADEGPFPDRYLIDGENFDWREATPEELRQKFRILNAIYLPDRNYAELYEEITPINTFPIIFNKYFGQELPALPNKSYSHFSEKDLYSFFDVTDATR